MAFRDRRSLYNGIVDQSQHFGALLHDLERIFDTRLRAVVSYGSASGLAGLPTPTLAIVEALTADDLRACAARVAAWQDDDLATPLLVPIDELARSLDAFPIEFCVILADHQTVFGKDPFTGLVIEPTELRRACEIQVRSHLLHLRQGYMETAGRGDLLADVMRRSAPALAALLKSVALLIRQEATDAATAAAWVANAIGVSATVLADVVGWIGRTDLAVDDARARWPLYLDAMTQLSDYVDRWSAG
jgi:hypothetical protein